MGQMLVRQLDDAIIEAVKKRAKANNRSAEAEVRAILESALVAKPPALEHKPKRSIMDFVGIAPSNRTTEEIVAEIRALRDEWDDR